MAQHQRRARQPSRIRRFVSWMTFARRGGAPAKKSRHGYTTEGVVKDPVRSEG